LFGLLPRFVVWVAGLCPAPGFPPFPRRSLPFLSSNPTSVRVVGGPPGWAWSSNTPLPNRAGTPPRLALGLPTPQRASPVGPPFDGAQPTGSGALVTHRQWAKPLYLGRPTDWVGRVEEGREDPGRGFDFEGPKRLRRFGFEGLCF
jgi:hypothetical protein